MVYREIEKGILGLERTTVVRSFAKLKIIRSLLAEKPFIARVRTLYGTTKVQIRVLVGLDRVG